jgi:hypothetical protein
VYFIISNLSFRLKRQKVKKETRNALSLTPWIHGEEKEPKKMKEKKQEEHERWENTHGLTR